jgi:sigma-B regulation protein RsbU (phosphoserine phosphatase)
MRILVVEDDRINREIITRHLQALNYEVTVCADGAEAWDIIVSNDISLVLSDWIMPRMDGIELCRKIRKTRLGRYIYTILVTSRDEKKDLVRGMDAGADDFLVKPVTREVLGACIRAGERILALERRLERRNRKLTESRNRLEKAYRIMKKDLAAAARVQQSLIPTKSAVHPGVRFQWLFQPCSQVAGDIFNYFPMDERHLGFYLLDVSGHGIPAAMLSVMISKLLVPDSAQDNLLKRSQPEPPYYRLVPPDEVVRDLNRRFQSEGSFSRYFTMIYGIIDRVNGRVSLCQAGHPHPVVIRSSGTVEIIGQNGFPVGILPDLEYTRYEVQLYPHDRLMLYSDGITGCLNREKKEYGLDRLTRSWSDNRDNSLATGIQALEEELRQWNGPDAFADDMTLLAVEFTGVGHMNAQTDERPTAHRAMEIEGKLDQVYKVRRFVNAFCKHGALAGDDREGRWSMELAVHETMTNIIRHAFDAHGSNPPIRIEGLAYEDRIEFLIIYDGLAFEPECVPEPHLDGSQSAHFGLYLIRQCMDQTDYQTQHAGEKCIRLVKNRLPTPSQ